MFIRSALLFILLQAACWASLIGTNVTLNYDFNLSNTVDSLLVGAGVEVSCPGPANVCTFLTAPGQTVDIGDFTIRYDSSIAATFTPVSPNQFRFTDIALPGAISDVSLATNIVGLDASRVSFTADSVTVSMSGLPVVPGSFYELTLTQIPEPGTFVLAGFALAALTAWRRRRQ